MTVKRFPAGAAAFLARRLTRLLVAVVVVVTISFAMIHLTPGDPIRTALGPTAPEELVAARRAALGLDQPLLTQYVTYVRGLLTGDLGHSFVNGQSVTEVVATRLPGTVQLAALSLGLVLLLAVPTGLLVAVLTRDGRRRGLELGYTAVTSVFHAVPEYLLAVGLVFLFAVTWPVFPVAGIVGPSSYVLPVLSLAIVPLAVLTRIARAESLRALGADYVRTARGKRLSPRLVYFRHVLPNTLTAVLTLGGTMVTGLIVSSVLVEKVFNWPGLGSMIVQSIELQDYGLVQGITLVYAVVVLVANLIVDIVLGLLDRRTTLREETA
ncbi:peptide/nickel transport system permease protein [Streptosporangium becharense]|uniref:Peptide/nickel transport system permease protein n=1 Tax=Streptosporangium becharense TaxID=1816182 RepID=A0A7W9MK44_9ACTN|nr:ABC transporter permease [Streptosporangium becharense]MBB2910500.1 peptide/nickel transport system permease protein [Streptosporangium becharense]MBB5823243.1 peptide/nickel transport system permease protein [Streptosporangium becharense]